MRADLGALLDNGDGDVLACVERLLFQPDGGGQAGRAGADDDHVVVHGFALDRRFLMAQLVLDLFGGHPYALSLDWLDACVTYLNLGGRGSRPRSADSRR